uniref:Uncharacterized protein n=1 Tax=Streptomyces sp. NBC_00093 TaxID=2975649 RepID=A0AAU1ZUL4_9ACTN
MAEVDDFRVEGAGLDDFEVHAALVVSDLVDPEAEDLRVGLRPVDAAIRVDDAAVLSEGKAASGVSAE